MPNPNKARGAKSRANLRRGGPGGDRRSVNAKSPEQKAVQKIAQKLLDDPEYKKTLREKLQDGTLHPSIQVMLWYYAHGKPKEELDLKQPVPVRVVHQFAEEK